MRHSSDREYRALNRKGDEAELPKTVLEAVNLHRFSEIDRDALKQESYGFVDPVSGNYDDITSGVESDLVYLRVRKDQIKIPKGAFAAEELRARREFARREEISVDEISADNLNAIFAAVQTKLEKSTVPQTSYFDVAITPLQGHTDPQGWLVVVYATGPTADEISELLDKTFWNREMRLYRPGMTSTELFEDFEEYPLKGSVRYPGAVGFEAFLEWLWFQDENSDDLDRVDVGGPEPELKIFLDKSITLLSTKDPIRKVKVSVKDPGDTREARLLRLDGAIVTDVNLVAVEKELADATGDDSDLDLRSFSLRKAHLASVEMPDCFASDPDETAYSRAMNQLRSQQGWIRTLLLDLMTHAAYYNAVVSENHNPKLAKIYRAFNTWLRGEEADDS